MTMHPTKQELDDYCRRVLAPDAFLSVHRHVTACPSCAAHCNASQDVARDMAHLHEALLSEAGDTPYHLSAAEVAAYKRGGLDEIDLEIVESHLDTCTACLSQVERHAAEVQPVAFVSASRRSFSNWRPWQVAAAVFCGAILILMTFWLLRSRPAERKELGNWANVSSPESSPSVDVQAPAPELGSNGTAPNGPSEGSAQFALVLNDGSGTVSVSKEGQLAGLEQLPARIQQRVGAALRTGRIEQPAALAQLASRSSPLLGESRDGLPFRLVGPLGQVVRNQRPTFRWRPIAGAQSYKVVVTDVDLNEVATSPALDATGWRITQPLKSGVVYSWQVTALKDGVAITSPVLPAPQAKFKVIDRATAEMLQQTERAYPNSHVTLGVLYAEAGLLNEAEQQFHLLSRKNPGAGITKKLLRSVQSMRRMMEPGLQNSQD